VASRRHVRLGREMRTLVLGGTAWVGGEVARAALAAGHEVTCLARGSAPFPAGVTEVRHDRSLPLPDLGRFDVVVDVTSDPAHIATSIDTARYVLVSTGNVYASHRETGDDEAAPLLMAGGGPGDDYGFANVRCETAVAQAYPDHLLARSGLIAGPGDRTGRTTYWPWRFSRSAEVLVPADGEQPTQVLDVRDLARWLVTADAVGAVDAVGPVTTLADHLEAARSAVGHTGALIEADPVWLRENEVEAWAGPRSLPLWLDDPDWWGFAARSGEKARAHGLITRPLGQTLADGLAHLGSEVPASGLTDDDQSALLEDLRRD
jgi:2'-hydroxyisoflavone reductase